MGQFSATRCSCIAILWVNLVRFAAITLRVASQRVFIVVVRLVTDSFRRLLDIPSYVNGAPLRMLYLSSCTDVPIFRSENKESVN
jgi:hypothetical protein